MFHFCFNLILFGNLGHVNFDFIWSKSLLLRFPFPGKKSPLKISDPPPNTPYHYLETPVGDSDKFVLKKSVTETQCNRIVNH